ncbi:hypothetical protein [Streptomyces sp. TRM68367]|uniref:DUF7848 domain-containing protein n=1 Tax=Streptomyces sp. TRM68367 TaxID=2758415 RepID=UPI00165A76EF|nr:hypothetical protein [Streptomyces sp. TRM68367]MBC9727893.1 hypothetical protein [Streptomyces sp. TRM68367]
MFGDDRVHVELLTAKVTVTHQDGRVRQRGTGLDHCGDQLSGNPRATGCGLSSGPQSNPDDAQNWALKHTGRNPGHDLFRREYTDHARVTRAE